MNVGSLLGSTAGPKTKESNDSKKPMELEVITILSTLSKIELSNVTVTPALELVPNPVVWVPIGVTSSSRKPSTFAIASKSKNQKVWKSNSVLSTVSTIMVSTETEPLTAPIACEPDSPAVVYSHQFPAL